MEQKGCHDASDGAVSTHFGRLEKKKWSQVFSKSGFSTLRKKKWSQVFRKSGFSVRHVDYMGNVAAYGNRMYKILVGP
jgi:hypothetical protein